MMEEIFKERETSGVGTDIERKEERKKDQKRKKKKKTKKRKLFRELHALII